MTDHEHDWRYPPPAAMEDGVWYRRCEECGLTTYGDLVLPVPTAPERGTSSPAPEPQP